LEEISSASNPDPFPVSSSQRGVVTLRINYPFQSASMSGFQPSADPTLPPGPPSTPVIPIPAPAPPSGTSSSTSYLQPPSDVGEPMVSSLMGGFTANGGYYGMGQQAAWATTVQPYRRVISAQAIYRREVFQ
jgi:hypothetical protein